MDCPSSSIRRALALKDLSNLRGAGVSLLGLAIATKVKQERCPVHHDHLSSGVSFTELALQQGHTIQALVKDPLKMTIQHPRLRVTKGDALNPADINNILEGADGVSSFLGQDKTSQPDL